MRFASQGSGSRGNAHLIETRHVRVLVDCGFAAREIERRLELLEVEPTSLDAVLVTHLSEKNNSPERIKAALCGQHPQLEDRLSFAAQVTPSGWHELTTT